MISKKIDHEKALIDELRDPAEAAAYLNAAWEENDPELFLLALERVVKAHGVTKTAELAGINRQHLHRALSLKGNPTIKTLQNILTALDLELAVRPKKYAV